MDLPGPDVKALFTAALELPEGPARDASLAAACGGDAALRRRVEELLAAFERASDVLGPAGPPAESTEIGAAAAADTDAATVAFEASRPSGPEATGTPAGATGIGRTADHVPTPEPGEPATAAPIDGRDGDGLPPGTAVRYFGDYEILRELGRGGMGVVYQARQKSLDRLVALKMIRSAALATDDELRRFQNEAEAAARLDHPHIVPIFEVGRYEGQHYFTMKLVAGESLDRRKQELVADPWSAARMVAVTAGAIQHAHERGILHRDLKPANILVDPEGQPHITDFGLAKRVEGDSELTRSGAIMGTPAYMAPEMASGEPGAATTSTDVYGLGATLFALLTGRAPFGGTTPLETIEQVRGRAPELPRRLNPRVPRDLEVICLKCLEKEPDERYASAAALGADLRRFLAGEPITARPVARLERGAKWARRNPTLAAAYALGLLGASLGGLGGAALWQWRATERVGHAAKTAQVEAERQRDRALAPREFAAKGQVTIRASAPHSAQALANFAVRSSQPIIDRFGAGHGSIAIVLDCSGSMLDPSRDTRGTCFDDAKSALRQVVAQVPKGTNLSLWTFSQLPEGVNKVFANDPIVSEPELTIKQLRKPAPWDPGQDNELAKQLNRLRPHLETPLVQAMWTAASSDLTMARGPKTLLVLTDGDDNRLENNPKFNPGKLSVTKFIVARFKPLNIRVNIVFFRHAGDPIGSERARERFEQPLKQLDPPGSFVTAGNLAELKEHLRRGIAQRLTCQILRDGVPVGEEALDVTNVEAEADIWWPRGLQPGTYTLRMEADRTYRQNINLNPGDRVVLQLVEARGGGIAFAQVLEDGRGQVLAPDGK